MLSCINCKKPVEQEEAKLFAEVFICPDCYRVAELIYTRGKAELEQYLTLLKEMIRTSLISGTLQLKQKEGDNSMMNTLEHLRKAMKHKKGAEPCKKENTPPHVRTLAALGAQSSRPPSPVDTR